MSRDLSIAQFTRLLINAIESAGVDYMLGGSVALWAWGEFRSTADVDIIINLPIEGIFHLSAELEKIDILIPPDIMLDILLDTEGDLALNAIHPFSGFKADIFLMRGDESGLRHTSMQRRRIADLGDIIGKVYVHTPEDLILYKLQFYRINRQTKHVRDIQSILRSGPPLDEAYLTGWLQKLALTHLWGEITGNQ